MNKKSDLRILAKNIRKTLDIQSISKILCNKILDLDIYKSSENILIFYPLVYEVNLLSLISDDKKFYLPRVNGEYLDICPFKMGDVLIKNKFNVSEPQSEPVDISVIDLIILPALAADINNYRLGYGKGYYDRLLDVSNAKTILPIPKELVFNSLPIENHDRPVDKVITD